MEFRVSFNLLVPAISPTGPNNYIWLGICWTQKPTHISWEIEGFMHWFFWEKKDIAIQSPRGICWMVSSCILLLWEVDVSWVMLYHFLCKVSFDKGKFMSITREALTRSFSYVRFGLKCRFIYTFLGLGAIVCLFTCFGHAAAETANGCCLYLVSFSRAN